MAPAATKKRENIHTDIGMVGRKTGFTIQTNLARDDDGMENMSAFFSPTSTRAPSHHPDELLDDVSEEDDRDASSDIVDPSEQVATRATNVSRNEGSATMEMEESTARSVTGALEARKGINTPAKRKSMGANVLPTPTLPQPSSTPPRNLSSPAIRRPQKGPTRAASSQLSKPSPQQVEAEDPRDSYGSHKENVPNSRDPGSSDGPEPEVPASAPKAALGARASGLRSTGPRGTTSSMLFAKKLQQARREIEPPQDEVEDLPEEPTLEESEMDIVPISKSKIVSKLISRPPPKSKPVPIEEPEEPEELEESVVEEEPVQKPKPGRKGKAKASKVVEEDPKVSAKTTSKKDKPAPSKRGRKPAKPVDIEPEVSEPEIIPVEEEDLEVSGINDQEIEEIPEEIPEEVLEEEPEEEPEEEEEVPVAEPSIPKKGKGAGRGRKKAAVAEEEPEPTSQEPGPKKRMGRPKKNAVPSKSTATEEEPSRTRKTGASRHKDDTQDEPEEETQPEKPAAERKRGRKRKADTLVAEANEAEAEEAAAGSPPKKQKGPKKSAVTRIEKLPVSRADADEATEGRRSKRNHIQPLQFWKNEKVSYKVAERAKTGTAVSLVAEVVRVDETPVSKIKKKARPWRPAPRYSAGAEPALKVTKRGRKKKSRDNRENEESSEESDVEDQEEDDWEKVGKLVGMVREWDTAVDGEDDDVPEEVEDEIATSRHGIEFKPIFGSDYLFAKTLGKPFMGCGILELRNGASKKLKSSGKMQLVFFILEGRVEAEVNELGFRIGKGGQFQVPRGNMYRIANPFKKTAKIFFSQACIPEPETESE